MEKESLKKPPAPAKIEKGANLLQPYFPSTVDDRAGGVLFSGVKLLKKGSHLMATQDQKYTALNSATEIAKAFSQGGSDKITPGFVLEESYKVIVKIMDEIEATPDKD